MTIKKFKLTAMALALSVSGLFAQTAIADVNPALIAAASQDGKVPSLAPMLKQVLPSVVNISIKGKKEVAGPSFNIPEEFKFMFPEFNSMPRQREFRALGSGVIVDAKKGYIVTNYHVVDGADDIRVALSDGREFEGKVIGGDEHTDLALIQLKDFSDLVAIEFSDSDNIEVGDFAIAIGNPFGLGQTVTSGIISGLGRSGLNIENIENFIQTDAAINSGNSGGALIDFNGKLIGINTAILGPNGGNIGIGFAIPVNMVKNVISQIQEFGEVKRGQLGITGSALTADLAKNFGYNQTAGAFVNEVLDKSAAQKAGIKPGDIITSIDGKKINSFGELRAKIATQAVGKEITLGIFRDGKELNVKVKLDASEQITAESSKSLSKYFEGAELSNTDQGVEITKLDKNSNAARFGLREGDIIKGVNRNNIKTLNDLQKYLKDSNGKLNAILIQRGNSTLFITVR